MEVNRNLKKHVYTIHSSNTLTLLQRKISNVLLYHAYDALLEKERHTIAINELRKMICYESNDYDLLKKSIKGLISTVIEWNLLKEQEEENIWYASAILASAKIDRKYCVYSYSPEMRDLLYFPKMYARINLKIQAKFKSSYGLALYENCIRYRKFNFTRWFDYETFRKLMGINKNKYAEFRNFKRSVLNKAVDEINRISDIKISYELKKIGGDCEAIRFIINPQTNSDNNFSDKNPIQKMTIQQAAEDNEILKAIMKNEFSLSDKQVAMMLSQYESSYILEKIKYVQNLSVTEKNKINNLGGYFVSALKGDYRLPVSGRNLNQQSETENEIEKINVKNEKLIISNYNKYLRKELDNYIDNLGKIKLDFLLSEFLKELERIGDSFTIKKLNQGGISNLVVRSVFRNFIRVKHKNLLPNIKSIEEFND